MAKTKRTRVSIPVRHERKKPELLPTLYIIILCAVAFFAPVFAGATSAVAAISIQTAIFLAALLRVVKAMKDRCIGLPGGLIAPVLLVFSVLLGISAFGSVSLHATLRELANMFGYLLVFLMVADLRGNRRAMNAVLASLVLSAMVVGAVGVKEYLMSYRVAGSDWRVFSTFFNPDYFAGFLVLLLPIVIAWFLSKTSISISAISAAAGLFTLGSLMLTGSRFGALAGFIGGVAFFGMAGISKSIGKSERIRLLIIIVPAFLAVAVLAKPLVHKLSGEHGVKAESHSMNFRLYTWQGTARMAAANPVKGTGLGTFEYAYPKYAKVGYTRLAHDSYLQLAAEAGPLAAVSLIVLLAITVFPTMWAVLMRRFRADDDDSVGQFVWEPKTDLLVCGLIAGVLASCARNLVDSDWYITAVGLSFWIVLGAVVGLAYPVERKVVRFTPNSYAAVSTGLALALVLLMFGLTGAGYFAEGDSLAMQGDIPAAMDAYKQAASIDRLDPVPHLDLAKCYMSMAEGLGNSTYAERAKDELETAASLTPTSGKTYYRLGKTLDYLNERDEAIVSANKALKYDPNSPEVLNLLAELLERSGKHSESLDIYRRMIQVESSPYEQVRAVPEFVEPLYIFAHAEIGRDFEAEGKKADAIKHYDAALKRIQNYQNSVVAMGAVLDASNRRNTALDARVGTVTADIMTRMAKLK